jgi:pyridoxal/pyridoxine/pyridoxamine kinase
MHSYSSEEMKPATAVARGFGGILKELGEDDKKRVVVVKNNKIEAVILSRKEYEKLKDAYDLLEKLYRKGLVSGV